MTVKEAVARRRSIRKFTGDAVSGEDLAELIETARLCPSSINAQPWRFRVVTDRETILWFSGEPTSRQGWIASAGAVIVCCVDPQAYARDSRTTLHAMRDAGLITSEFSNEVELYIADFAEGPEALLRGAAGLNLAIAMSAMMLRAVELGLGTTWVGKVDDMMVRRRLELPDAVAVMALLVVGHPAEAPEQRPRKRLEEILI